jgi:acyl-CoA reductase-like NAD-dependent aldehyde dehydrogenase
MTVTATPPAQGNGVSVEIHELERSIAADAAIIRKAQPAWAGTPMARRLEILRRFRRRLVAGAKEMAAALPPKSPAGAVEKLAAEVVPLADACLFLERRAATILAPVRHGARGRPIWLFGVKAEVRREPFGTILVIQPGNYPIFLAGVQILQALAAGNAVLVKPAEGCSRATRLLADWLIESGLDAGLVRVLPDSPAAGRLATLADVDKVFLTGSARTGRAVLAQLAPRLVPACMELSGCDPVFVLDGADLDLVAKAVDFGLRWNGSETCIAPRRVFISPEQAEALQQRLIPKLALHQYPVRGPAAVAAAQLMDAAVQAGARVLAGGPLPDRSGIMPTVLADVRPDMAIAREDSFAPVASILPCANPGEALRFARQSPYGLGSSIFGPPERAWELAEEVSAGGVVINDLVVPTADPRLPFGGRGASGYGVTRGVEGLLEMTTVKVVSNRQSPLYQHLDPLTPADEELFLSYLRGFHASSFWDGIAGRLRFFRLMMSKKSPK